ncbi:complex I assembly factor ACAD9, mitochondrial [Procambarus clarkii]|uniref:complex I assembly factor ACAD9, mitochondrial n=1 Tax=Procambarus clarkii TaxID=6728 RepID=UPI001E678E9A|nr:complex I assembly factor ACAD9, mitochondrial-like [Procambarus clarkii]
MLRWPVARAVLGQSGPGRVIQGLTEAGHRAPGTTKCLGTTARVSSAGSQVQELKDEGHTQPATAKKPSRPPFIKNLFLGRFDKEMLVFPEVLDKEQHELLHEMIVPIERFFIEQVDGVKIDKEAKIPPETLQGLKELGLYGQQIPEEFGGLGLGATEYARIAEITALDGSIGVTLAAHQAIGLKGILITGTREQKEKYLPRLASGEWTAAFCLTEPSSGSDAASIQTKAKLSEDGKTWLLNGSKIWISNGGSADLMTVFAKTPEIRPNGEIDEKVTAFIVERGFAGVSSGAPEDKMGIRGSDTCEVYFDNTPVPVENVLGEVGGGFKVAMNILNSGRFSMGSSGAGIMKKLIGWSMEHAVTRKQFGSHLSDFALIKEKFARMSVATYAMESMAYLTAGVLDSQENADCSVEAALVKVFSSEAVWQWGSECLQILGGLGYMKSYPFERYLRDSRILLIFEGTNEILRLFIALTGLHHAGLELREMVRKLRNPVMNPGFIFTKVIEKYRQQKDYPKLDLELASYVHPTLKPGADVLEYSVKRFQYSVETVLARHGMKVTDPKNQMELARLANCAIDIYGMTAVLARASRSYCIGIANSSHEVQLALTFCDEASARVKKMVKDIEDGPRLNNDNIYIKIADTMIENKGYAAEHPLTRVFW